VSQDYAGFKSIQAKTVFSRCQRAFPPFDAAEANRVGNRNTELHSASPGFTELPMNVWWQRFWRQAVLLAAGQDRSIEGLVGEDHVAVVEGHLAADRAWVAMRFQAAVARAQQRLELAIAGTAPRALLAAIQAVEAARTSYQYSTFVSCPACESARAALFGDYVTASEIETEYVNDLPVGQIELLSVAPEALSCGTCGQLLEGPELVGAAGFQDDFSIEQEYEPDYGDYGND
jgi:hypothetical protein